MQLLVKDFPQPCIYVTSYIPRILCKNTDWNKIKAALITVSSVLVAFRFRFTEAGSFRCCYTDLIFEVRGAVTITYQFDSWEKHRSTMDIQNLMIAGPLLDIQADPMEAVAAVHFPHFLCLTGEEKSHLYIAHFLDEGMSLEKPDHVGPFHAALKDPTFSLFGIILQTLGLKQNIMVHAVVLLYQVLEIPVPKFHLYLLPREPNITMVKINL
uniref:FIIND domain-containing protein n=1 Tax=Salvator merianae TaxID=96440 RepID=A0A8D0BL42_SALMN